MEYKCYLKVGETKRLGDDDLGYFISRVTSDRFCIFTEEDKCKYFELGPFEGKRLNYLTKHDISINTDEAMFSKINEKGVMHDQYCMFYVENGKLGLLNLKDEVLLPAKYDDIDIDTANKLVVCKIDNTIESYDKKTLKLIHSNKIVSKDVEIKDKSNLDISFLEMPEEILDFVSDMTSKIKIVEEYSHVNIYKYKNKFGFISKQSNKLITFPIYDEIIENESGFGNNFDCYQGDFITLRNENGEKFFDFEYTDAYHTVGKGIRFHSNVSSMYFHFKTKKEICRNFRRFAGLLVYGDEKHENYIPVGVFQVKDGSILTEDNCKVFNLDNGEEINNFDLQVNSFGNGHLKIVSFENCEIKDADWAGRLTNYDRLFGFGSFDRGVSSSEELRERLSNPSKNSRPYKHVREK